MKRKHIIGFSAFFLTLLFNIGCKQENVKTEMVNKLIHGTPQTLVVYGTSIESNVNGHKWVSKVAETIQKRYPGQLTCYNSGLSGKDSRWALANLKDSVLSRKPDLVILEFTTNDAVDYLNITIEQSRTYTENMIKKIKEVNPSCEIVLLTACGYPLGKGAEKRKNLHQYTDVYRDIAREQNLPLIDIASFLKDIGDNFGVDSLKYYVRDGIHSSDAGAMELFYPEVYRALTGVYPEKQ